MPADLWREKIEAFVDEELSADEAARCAEHLKECAACASESLALMQLKRMTQRAGKKFLPSADFQARIAKTVSTGAPRTVSRQWIPLALAASILLATLFAVRQVDRGQTRIAARELVDMHVAAMASTNLVDVVSSDRHTVKPWFQGRIPFTFTPPELANSPYTLLGGRVAYFHQNPGAQLIYEMRKHRISVFIFRDTAKVPSAAAAGTASSFTQMAWSANGLQYFLVTDASPAEAGPLKDLFVASK